MPENAESLVSPLEEPIHLAAFEGPLDLLLFLVRRNEVDIYDIPIGEIATQYMEIIRRAEDSRLEVAGEFFVLAATLMRIKSRMLLPAQERPAPDADDVDDPRWELAKMLLEYNRYKDAAVELRKLVEAATDLIPRRFTEEAAGPVQEQILEASDSFDVWEAYNRVMKRLRDRMTEGMVEAERVSVSDCIARIRELAASRGSFLFTDLFPATGPVLKTLVAANFLGILELTRLAVLQLRQSANFDDIQCISLVSGV